MTLPLRDPISLLRVMLILSVAAGLTVLLIEVL